MPLFDILFLLHPGTFRRVANLLRSTSRRQNAQERGVPERPTRAPYALAKALRDAVRLGFGLLVGMAGGHVLFGFDLITGRAKPWLNVRQEGSTSTNRPPCSTDA